MPDASRYGMSREQIAEMMDVPVELLGDPNITYANAEDDYREQFNYVKSELEKHLRTNIIRTPNVPADVAIVMSFRMDAPPDHVVIHFSHATPICDQPIPALGEN